MSSSGGAGYTNLRLGVPHRAGRYRPRGAPFSSPVCWSCGYAEGFLVQGWDLVPPRVARALRISSLGFHAARGVIDPEDHRFRPQFVGIVDIRKDL